MLVAFFSEFGVFLEKEKQKRKHQIRHFKGKGFTFLKKTRRKLLKESCLFGNWLNFS